LQGALVGSSTALAFMAWICYSAQHAIATGELKFDTKVVDTSGCSYHFIADEALNMLAINETTSLPPLAVDGESAGFQIYHISYLWYTLLGTSITIVISLVVSYITGPNIPNELNPNLLAPFVRKLIKPRPSEAVANDTAANVIAISFQLKSDNDDDDDNINSSSSSNDNDAGNLWCARLAFAFATDNNDNNDVVDASFAWQFPTNMHHNKTMFMQQRIQSTNNNPMW